MSRTLQVGRTFQTKKTEAPRVDSRRQTRVILRCTIATA